MTITKQQLIDHIKSRGGINTNTQFLTRVLGYDTAESDQLFEMLGISNLSGLDGVVRAFCDSFDAEYTKDRDMWRITYDEANNNKD